MTNLDCQETKRQVHEYLHNELNESEIEDITSHLANCDSCEAVLEFEFAVETKLTKEPLQPAANARIAELGWASEGAKHRCPKCQQAAQ